MYHYIVSIHTNISHSDVIKAKKRPRDRSIARSIEIRSKSDRNPANYLYGRSIDHILVHAILTIHYTYDDDDTRLSAPSL